MKKHVMTVLLVLLVMMFPASVFATDAGTVTYDGKNLNGDYNTIDVSSMQPGDTQEYEITVKNDGKEETDWWMSNKVLKTLEENSDASGGAYTYVLKYNDTVIYSNDTVGGEVETTGGGLKEATNALDKFFHFTSLKPGDSGVVTLTVTLDGESQGNIYQNTTGEIELIFAVEPHETNPPAQKVIHKDRKVKTGDDSNMLPYYIVAFGAGALLLVLGLGRMKKTRKEDGANE